MRPCPMRLSLFALGFLGFGLLSVGCSPATQYNKGIEMSYHPSAKADAQERLVSSAVELNQDSDQALIKQAGALYLGELEVIAAKNSGFASSGQGAKKGLSGRVSLEAANRGATHFYLAASKVEHTVQQSSGPHIGIGGAGSSSSEQVAKTHARYVLFRVEQDKWSELPKEYQPEAMPGAQPTTTTAAASPETKAAEPAAKPEETAPASPAAAPPKK